VITLMPHTAAAPNTWDIPCTDLSSSMLMCTDWRLCRVPGAVAGGPGVEGGPTAGAPVLRGAADVDGGAGRLPGPRQGASQLSMHFHWLQKELSPYMCSNVARALRRQHQILADYKRTAVEIIHVGVYNLSVHCESVP
jgi:hypothetical protein